VPPHTKALRATEWSREGKRTARGRLYPEQNPSPLIGSLRSPAVATADAAPIRAARASKRYDFTAGLIFLMAAEEAEKIVYYCFEFLKLFAVQYAAMLKQTGIRILAGSVIGSLALWMAARKVDWQVLWQALRNARYEFVGLALLVILITLTIQAVRWRLLFYPEHRDLPLSRLFCGVVLAQMFNILIPARLGEVARIYSIESRGRIGRIRILSTIVVEKAVDLCAVACTIFLLLFTVSLPAWLRDSGKALLLGSVFLLAALLFLALRGDALLRWLERLAERLPGRWGHRIAQLGRSTLDGLSAVRSGRISFYLWGLTFFILLLAAGTNYLLFLAFGLNLPPIAALFLLIVLQIGIAPPSLPGKIGVFNYLVVLGLSVYSVDSSIALSYSFALYAVALLPKIILGALILAGSPSLSPTRAPRTAS